VVTDHDLEKLIVVTQSLGRRRGGRLDSKAAKDIEDGLAAYEQELIVRVGGARADE
jgi:hypothetical protein